MNDRFFLPKILKEILTHIPVIAFRIVEWKTFLQETGPILRRLSKKSPDSKIFKSLTELNINGLSIHSLQTEAAQKSESAFSKKASEILLLLYFKQFLNPDGIFLDLRAKHFYEDKKSLHFFPNNLWVQFEPRFKADLINLYCGFYWEDDKIFEQSLTNLGLMDGLNQQTRQQLMELFKKHFGMGDQTEVTFYIAKFQASFYDLFHFFLQHNIKLKTEFLFLGVYLATLYLTLESAGCSFNIKKIFLAVFPNPKGP